MRGVLYDQRRADVLRDEAPTAYKDIGRVMRAQRDLTRIERLLHPLLVYKGS
jgi:tRNA-splicing ligase RtcB